MKQLLAKTIKMAYLPTIKFPGDTSNFNAYPDSDHQSPPLNPNDDPFLKW